MKSKPIALPEKKDNERIIVKLDARTIIVVHSKSILKVWKRRYPDAKILD
jgi:hypothetical protein